MTRSHTTTTKRIHPDHEVAIIGAGPGGIAAGVKLAAAGIDDFVILERDTDFGGSWHENTYPGLSVDIPWPAYQFSFDRRTDWERFFPYGPEVKHYHTDVARKYGLYPHARFGVNVQREEFDDANHLWRLHTSTGQVITARHVISAVGAFVRPKADAIPGVETYTGKLQRPTAWDHDYDLTGKRVAVIGTGASAVQIIPAIADRVGAMTVFQRTPVWSMPKPDFRTPRALKALLGVPGVLPLIHQAILVVVDMAGRFLVSTPPNLVKPFLRAFDKTIIKAYGRYVRLLVKDPVAAAALTPDFGPITKRPTANTYYLTTFNRTNVDLVTDSIETVTATGIRTRDGVERDFDAIVLATGYDVFSDPETYVTGTIVGRNGFDLGEFYRAEGLQAYQGVTVAGLPNRFMLVGPYCWTGSGWHDFVEMSADHAVRAITECRRRGATLLEIRKDVADEYHRTIHRNSEILRYYLADLNGGTNTYYRNSQGDTTYLRPSGFFEASRGLRQFPLDDYRYEQLAAVPAAKAGSNGKAAAAAEVTA
ncbi:flavin-containing monooxygenase [Nocardia huaxiensis]|uniref:flavin-containing monooxygenase n=1 Tax=Nocardia huaxiensis TaxID=2755382 RepID=UPI001FD49E24|nr:NAD(P)/FAD-dependent oxidoreductase [Nocardia huaxiensis]